jgi:hypothetical protein
MIAVVQMNAVYDARLEGHHTLESIVPCRFKRPDPVERESGAREIHLAKKGNSGMVPDRGTVR